VWITEFKAVSNGSLLDEDGSWSDWIELYNAGPAAIDLDGWFLTDDRADLLRWSFPATRLAPGAFLLVFASAKNRRIPGRELHANFTLKAAGEYLALVEPDGLTIAQEFAPGYPEQGSGFSYGFPMNGTNAVADAPAFLIETPGRANPPAGASMPLALTELMYHPASPTGATPSPTLPFAFVELKNIGSNTLNLDGVFFGDGIHFTFPAYLLAPGARVLVVYNAAAFESRYGSGLPVIGQFTGALSDSGERLALYGPDGATIFNFVYDNSWHRITDGHGFSLVPVREDAPPSSYGRSTTWRASGQRHGSPGRLDPPSSVPPVYLNEVLTRAAPPYEDAIELFNPNTNDVDISGWLLTDNFDKPSRFKMPYGAVVPAGGFLAMDGHTFSAANDDPLGTGFGLGDFGEEIYLFSAATNGDLTGFVHGFKFGTAETNVTFGRYISSTGEERFVPQLAITFLETNAGPKIGPVVISEIFYHPPDLGGVDNKRDEFVELHNISAMPIPLYDPGFPSNTWRLADAEGNAVSFAFPTGVVLSAGSYALIARVGSNDVPGLRAFREINHVAPGTPVFGPWTGSLPNRAGKIQLLRPDVPEPLFVPYIVLDEVGYSDSLPWPLGADGSGGSIQRIHDGAYADDPVNWRVAFPSPGSPGGLPPIVVIQPSDQTAPAGSTVVFTVGAAGDAPLTYQWRFNGADLEGAIGPTLLLTNVLPAQTGGYACRVSNPAGPFLSRIAMLRVIDDRPPSVIVTSPAGPILRVGVSPYLFMGRSTDNVEVTTVLAQIGAGPFVPVDGTTEWSVALPLHAGFNLVNFVALDSAGNRSTTNSVEALLQPDPARLGLVIRGSGNVSGARDGQLLRIGRRYNLRAFPAPGHLFNAWNGIDGNLLSTNTTFSFVMSSNLTLAASFSPGPFIGFEGAYNGLFADAIHPAHTNAGYFSLNVTARGAFSGRLGSRGQSYALHGLFNSNLGAYQAIQRAGSNELLVTFQLVAGSQTVTGIVSEARFSSALAGHRFGFSKASLATNYTGRYSATLSTVGALSNSPGPVVVSISGAGRILLHGRLPDRTPVATEVTAGMDGAAPLYLSLYHNSGSAFGWLSFTNPPPHPLASELLWTRTGARGFTNILELRGDRSP
jgi:hypothetical protein